MARATTPEPVDEGTRLDPELKRVAAAIVVGGLAVILDTTIISVALHELVSSLQASVATIQWVSTAYLLAMFVAIPVTAWAQSRVGSKRLWLLGLGLFTLGSLLCAFSWSASSLIAFRALQGLGGGVMMPLMTTILMQAAGGRIVGRLMATVSLPAALGPILGPVLGGVILNYLSWRWIFLVNLPLGVIGLTMAIWLFPPGVPGRRTSLDVVGLLLVSPGMVLVIFGLTQVSEAGGFAHPRVLVPLLAGLVLVAAFVTWAIRLRDRALIDVRLLGHRALAGSTSLLFLTGTALYGAMLLLPLYWQQVRGESALDAGLLLVPQGVGALASRTVAGRLTDAVGGRAVAAVAFTVLSLATVPFALATESTPTWWLMATLLVRGLGLGAAVIPLMTGSFLGLEHDQIPHASIIVRVSQQLGGSFGVAVLATILATGAAGATTLDEVAAAFDSAFWWVTAVAALAVPLSLLLPQHRAAATG